MPIVFFIFISTFLILMTLYYKLLRPFATKRFNIQEGSTAHSFTTRFGLFIFVTIPTLLITVLLNLFFNWF